MVESSTWGEITAALIIPTEPTADEMKKHLDTSGGQTRNLVVAFVPIMLFMIAAVASTTHLDLFLPDR